MASQFICKLVDYVISNAYSVDSAGLYDGKSGMALCLFEVARYLNNETLADKAFELLQESLVFSNKMTNANIDFQNGLSGIGFALLYLIENRFLDANFEELFGKQINQILLQLKKRNVFFAKDLSLLYFLEFYSHCFYYKSNKLLTNKLLGKTSKLLKKHLKTINLVGFNIDKHETLNLFKLYLKTISICTNYSAFESLLNQYIELYKQEKIACCFITGYYLKRMVTNKNNVDIAETIKEDAVKNIYIESYTLSQKIDLLYLLTQEDQLYQKQIDLLEKGLFDWKNLLYEKQIIQSIPTNQLIAGYGCGVARLLLYCVYKENRRNSLDCSRFRYLF